MRVERSARCGLAGLLALALTGPVRAVEIDRLHGHVAYLASDELAGRAPGSDGEERTTDWIVRELAAAGVESAGPEGWLQPVALIERRPLAAEAQFRFRRRPLRLDAAELHLIARDSESRVAAPLYFAGRGLTDDVRMRSAVAGKVVLFDLPVSGDVAGIDRAMREEMRRFTAAGAAAVLAVVEPGQSFAALRAGRERPTLTMATDDSHAPIEGVVSEALVVAMISAAGGDWDAMRARASAPGFAGEAIRIDADLVARSAVRRFDSHNVVGRIEGRRPASGALLVMAHWDGLGLCGPEGADDRICNGAADNASGIAALIEIARELVRRRHDRDIFLVATTGEEHGLVGARAFAADPPRPLGQFIGAFNIDMLGLAPPATPVTVIGTGQTRFEEAVRAAIVQSGRGVAPPDTARDFLRRQDGAVLIDRNMPVLMVNRSFGDAARLAEFLATRYHGPGDETAFLPSWEGLADDVALHVELVRRFADSRRWRASVAR